MTEREEIKRIHKKLDTIAQKGEIAIMDYYSYIDELIDEGKYSLLFHTMIVYYKLDIRHFKTIDEFKKNSFKDIRYNTTSVEQKKLNLLKTEKSVYNLGTHFYNSDNNVYLGDIIETEPTYVNNLHLMNLKPWDSINMNINVVKGLSSAIFESIPQFGSITYDSFFYVTQSQVLYENIVYECVNSFTWSKGDSITPTFSEYFTQSVIPKYMNINISDRKLSLVDKYSLGIDILKL